MWIANVGMLPLRNCPSKLVYSTDGEIEAALDQGYLFAPKDCRSVQTFAMLLYQLRIGTGIWFLSRRVNEKGGGTRKLGTVSVCRRSVFPDQSGGDGQDFLCGKGKYPFLNVMAHAIPVGKIYMSLWFGRRSNLCRSRLHGRFLGCRLQLLLQICGT